MVVSFVRRLLLAAYLAEAGVLLIIAPWTASWQHNYFGALVPALGRAMVNEFVRGAVSGVGVVTLLAGLRDLTSAVFARHADRPHPPAPTRGLS